MTGEVQNLFTCSACGKVAKPRQLVFAEDERHMVSLTACDECLARSEKFLAKVRPVFDQMIKIGVPNAIANEVMSKLLELVTDDAMLEPPSAKQPNSQ